MNDYTIRYSEDEWTPHYETLVGPDGQDIATLTEPEDRTFGRDLEPILKELRRMRQGFINIAVDGCENPDSDWLCVDETDDPEGYCRPCYAQHILNGGKP